MADTTLQTCIVVYGPKDIDADWHGRLDICKVCKNKLHSMVTKFAL